jgi:hypothetical protein
VQIAVREWWDFRHDQHVAELTGAQILEPPPASEPA